MERGLEDGGMGGEGCLEKLMVRVPKGKGKESEGANGRERKITTLKVAGKGIWGS